VADKHDPESPVLATHNAKRKAPLPQARRAAPVVNIDAGEWAMQPARLPPAVEHYRWALEDLRIALFTPESAPRPLVPPNHLAALWKKVEAESRAAAAR